MRDRVGRGGCIYFLFLYIEIMRFFSFCRTGELGEVGGRWGTINVFYGVPNQINPKAVDLYKRFVDGYLLISLY